MPRSIKQFLYGLFYLAVIGLVAYVFFGAASPAAPAVCTENCPPSPPTVQIGAPLILKAAGNGYLEILVRVTNPSTAYGASALYYNFDLKNTEGKTVAALPPTTDDLYPGETKYLLGVYSGDPVTLAAVASATLTIAPPTWRPATAFPSPALALVAGPMTAVASSSVNVASVVENVSGGVFPGGRALAIIADKYQDPLFAGETVVSSLPPLATSTVTVTLPADPAFASRIDPSFTQLFLYQ